MGKDEVERYGCFHCDGMEPNDKGDWVLYSDYLKLKEQLKKVNN